MITAAGEVSAVAIAINTELVKLAGKDPDTAPVATLGAIRRATGLEHLR